MVKRSKKQHYLIMRSIQYIFFFLFFVSSPVSSAFIVHLDETDIGRAVINEDIDGYRKAWGKLKSLPSSKAFGILTAKDRKGNNLLHLMAQVKRSQEAFAGEMFQLSIILIDDFNNHDIFDDLNKKGLSPKEVAMQEGNSIAAEYLTTASNRVKKMRNVPSVVEGIEGKSGIWPNIKATYGVLGGFAVINGVTLFLQGDPASALLLGVPQIVLGWRACHQSFNMLEEENNSSNTKK